MCQAESNSPPIVVKESLMFQPEAKLEFIGRYCQPANGWNVFVDIDPSEGGRTGSEGPNDKARECQRPMQKDGETNRRELKRLGVTIGGNRRDWFREHGLPYINGDRDIVVFNTEKRQYLIVEVEGRSSGQPEQKLYKAIGQIVKAASDEVQAGWKRNLPEKGTVNLVRPDKTPKNYILGMFLLCHDTNLLKCERFMGRLLAMTGLTNLSNVIIFMRSPYKKRCK
jgi:hypothetical protein